MFPVFDQGGARSSTVGTEAESGEYMRHGKLFWLLFCRKSVHFGKRINCCKVQVEILFRSHDEGRLSVKAVPKRSHVYQLRDKAASAAVIFQTRKPRYLTHIQTAVYFGNESPWRDIPSGALDVGG